MSWLRPERVLHCLKAARWIQSESEDGVTKKWVKCLGCGEWEYIAETALRALREHYIVRRGLSGASKQDLNALFEQYAIPKLSEPSDDYEDEGAVG